MKKVNSNKKIIDYLKGNLDPFESQKLEESFLVSDFENDALDGLTQIKDKDQIEYIVNDLDSLLKKEIRRKRKKIFNTKELILITLISLITILLTIFMAFYIYHMMQS